MPASKVNGNSEKDPDAERKQIEKETQYLRACIGLSPDRQLAKRLSIRPPKIQSEVAAKVKFWVEVAYKDAFCRICGQEIAAGEYRIDSQPSFTNTKTIWGHTSIFYHIQCFEKIADFSQVAYFDRIRPRTRRLDGPVGFSELAHDDRLAVDAGTEILVEEWKEVLGRLICERERRQSEDMRKAANDTGLASGNGTTKYTIKIPKGDQDATAEILPRRHVYGNEWNFFEEFLTIWDEDPNHLNNRFTLSQSLANWELGKVVARDYERNTASLGHPQKVLEMKQRLSSHPPEVLELLNNLRRTDASVVKHTS